MSFCKPACLTLMLFSKAWLIHFSSVQLCCAVAFEQLKTNKNVKHNIVLMPRRECEKSRIKLNSFCGMVNGEQFKPIIFWGEVKFLPFANSLKFKGSCNDKFAVYCAKAASIVLTTSASATEVCGPNEVITLPDLPTKNF